MKFKFIFAHPHREYGDLLSSLAGLSACLRPSYRHSQKIFLLILLTSLVGCGPINPAVSSTSPLPTPTLPPLALAVDVLPDAVIVPLPTDPPSFNAYLNDTGYEALIAELVYGALAEIGPDGTYYPELAQELPTLANGGLSEDGLTVTWRLRPNILWSDGQPFSSEDVRYTWQSLRDSGIWAPGFDLMDFQLADADALISDFPNHI